MNDKHKTMHETCNFVTGKEFLNIECESAHSYLNLWFNAVKWANEGLPLSESIDMEKCSKDQINKLAQAVHKYLNGTMGFKNIAMRHFFQFCVIKLKMNPNFDRVKHILGRTLHWHVGFF